MPLPRHRKRNVPEVTTTAVHSQEPGLQQPAGPHPRRRTTTIAKAIPVLLRRVLPAVPITVLRLHGAAHIHVLQAAALHRAAAPGPTQHPHVPHLRVAATITAVRDQQAAVQAAAIQVRAIQGVRVIRHPAAAAPAPAILHQVAAVPAQVQAILPPAVAAPVQGPHAAVQARLLPEAAPARHVLLQVRDAKCCVVI